jgi:archaellum component FlaC
MEDHLSEDKASYKRKYNDILNEFNEYKDKFEKSIKGQHGFESKIAELEGRLER